MKLITVKPHKDESYQVSYDDHCIVVKQGKNKVWLSKSMIEWLYTDITTGNHD